MHPCRASPPGRPIQREGATCSQTNACAPVSAAHHPHLAHYVPPPPWHIPPPAMSTPSNASTPYLELLCRCSAAVLLLCDPQRLPPRQRRVLRRHYPLVGWAIHMPPKAKASGQPILRTPMSTEHVPPCPPPHPGPTDPHCPLGSPWCPCIPPTWEQRRGENTVKLSQLRRQAQHLTTPPHHTYPPPSPSQVLGRPSPRGYPTCPPCPEAQTGGESTLTRPSPFRAPHHLATLPPRRAVVRIPLLWQPPPGSPACLHIPRDTDRGGRLCRLSTSTE